MWELITADGSLPFSVSLALMLALGLVEGLMSLVGAGLSGVFDALMPDLDLHAHADFAGPDHDGGLSRVLGWLRIGEVPVLMLLVIALTTFGLLGLGVQALSRSALGFFLPAWMASIPAFLLSLPSIRMLGGGLHRVMPKDETTAVSAESLVGRVAVVTLGVARAGHPAEAKVRDQHGQMHYFLVEPDDDQEFPAGSEVLLVQLAGSRYRVIANPNPHLSERSSS